MIYLYTFLAFVFLWCLVPHIMVWLLPIGTRHKVGASLCFLRVAGLHTLNLPVSMMAPLVVPIALLFTKWEDDKLPRLFWMWDNDVSINGDRKEDWAVWFKGNAYYAKAPPRSFWARYVWLGWRNRASAFAEYLGYKYKPGEFENRVVLGNPHTSRTWADGEGWVLNIAGPAYQYMMIKHISSKTCIRVHWGNKIFGRERAPIVAISFSLLSWRVEA